MKITSFILCACACFCATPGLRAQEISLLTAWGYDEYKAEFLDASFLQSETGSNTTLFQTRMHWEVGAQIKTRRSFIIRPRLLFGSIRLPEKGISGQNSLDPGITNKKGFSCEGTVDVGKVFPIIPEKLNVIGGMGAGMGIANGRYDMGYNADYEFWGRVFSLQPSIQLEFVFKSPLRIAIEQRHELGIQYYGQNYDDRYFDYYWRHFTTAKSKNYLPPVLSVSWVIQDRKKENIPFDNQ